MTLSAWNESKQEMNIIATEYLEKILKLAPTVNEFNQMINDLIDYANYDAYNINKLAELFKLLEEIREVEYWS